MAQGASEQVKADFQAAASTIKCDRIEQYVTLVVRNDWSASCHWCAQYKELNQSGSRTHRIPKKVRPLLNRCEGPMCEHVVSYRDRLMEEARAKHKDTAAS